MSQDAEKSWIVTLAETADKKQAVKECRQTGFQVEFQFDCFIVGAATDEIATQVRRLHYVLAVEENRETTMA